MYEGEKTIIYSILTMDNSEAMLARIYSDGEVEVVFEESSWIDNHHKNGGYSAARFQRIRQEQIKQWYRKINDKLKLYSDEIILDMNHVALTHFKKELHPYNLSKVKKETNSGYTGMCGVYQTVAIIQRQQ